MISNKSDTRVIQIKFFMIFDAVPLVGTKLLFRFYVLYNNDVVLL